MKFDEIFYCNNFCLSNLNPEQNDNRKAKKLLKLKAKRLEMTKGLKAQCE